MCADKLKVQSFSNAEETFINFQSEALSDKEPIHNWRECFPEIIGNSESLLLLLKDVSKIARSDSSTLIYGESGTGKELIAAALHRLSPRSKNKFVAINCSAIPEDLLESELFGYEKGAFTGAVSRKIGFFEVANGGTIFLDEIGDMPGRLQAKLLRVLQEKKYNPVGSTQVKNTDVRIIAATNVELEKAVEEKKFRLDLYYRLNVIPLKVPPLRERKGDISQLLDHFINISNDINNLIPPCYFSDEVYSFLKDYGFPGNVRELQNLVERVVVIKGGGVIKLEDLPENTRNDRSDHRKGAYFQVSELGNSVNGEGFDGSLLHPENVSLQIPEQGFDLCSFVEKLENNCILQALKRTGNNKNRAAKLLGLNRTTLVERIKKRKLAPLNPPSKEI